VQYFWPPFLSATQRGRVHSIMYDCTVPVVSWSEEGSSRRGRCVHASPFPLPLMPSCGSRIAPPYQLCSRVIRCSGGLLNGPVVSTCLALFLTLCVFCVCVLHWGGLLSCCPAARVQVLVQCSVSGWRPRGAVLCLVLGQQRRGSGAVGLGWVLRQ
jgi:hypothetical protein